MARDQTLTMAAVAKELGQDHGTPRSARERTVRQLRSLEKKLGLIKLFIESGKLVIKRSGLSQLLRARTPDSEPDSSEQIKQFELELSILKKRQNSLASEVRAIKKALKRDAS